MRLPALYEGTLGTAEQGPKRILYFTKEDAFQDLKNLNGDELAVVVLAGGGVESDFGLAALQGGTGGESAGRGAWRAATANLHV